MRIDTDLFLAASDLPSLQPSTERAPVPGFDAWFSREIAQVNGSLVSAERGSQGLAVGEQTNLHGLMIGIEQAKLSLQLLVQVRNHLLDAYQDVMRMQI